MDELLDHAPCGFIVFTDDGLIRQVNATMAGWLGYVGKEELTDQPIEAIFTLSSRIFYQTHLFPLITLHGRADEVFLSLQAKDKTDVPVIINALRKFTEAQPTNHCVFVPVKERRKYEDELLKARRTAEDALHRNELLLQTKEELEEHKQELDRQVSWLSRINAEMAEFSSVITHDLQEPIRRILMFADVIYREQKTTLAPNSEITLRKIRSAAERMRRLISNLHQFVSVDVAGVKTDRVDLQEVFEIAKYKLAEQLPIEAARVTGPDLPSLDGNATQLELLFHALLQNSVRFKSAERDLIVQVHWDIIQQNSYRAIRGKYRYMDFVRITYTDNGTGFDNQYSDYIFRLFKKINTDSEGIGFGLALAKKIVEFHHGSISARGQPGRGATFTILLPLTRQ